MTAAVPDGEWTDEEWLRALNEFPPGADVREVEQAVARWRAEPEGDPHE